MSITHSVLLCELATSFLTSSFFQLKMINLYQVHVISQDIEYQLQENILHHFFIIAFY